MLKLGRMSIRTRILATFILLSCLALYHFYDWVYLSARRHYLEAAEEVMHDELTRLSGILEKNGVTAAMTQASLKQFLQQENTIVPARIYQVQKQSLNTFVYVTDANGLVLYHSIDESLRGRLYKGWRNVALALAGRYGARSTRKMKDDPSSSVMHISIPLYNQGQIVGSLTIAKPVASLYPYLQGSRQRLFLRGLWVLAFLLAAGFVLVKYITDPIEHLRRYVADFRQKESPPKPRLPRGELQELADTIDDMRLRLEGKDYVESYVQALTHELKSPLAAIRGAVELLEDGNLPSTDRRLLRNLDRESRRMDEMIQKLLLLSRLENRERLETFETLDLEVLLKEVVENCREQFGRQITFCLSADACQIMGDRFSLSLAIHNLLQNAHEFSPSDKPIDVKLVMLPSELGIIVTDQGSGIPEYALQRIFERFYSLPRPVSGAKSSGLGLAIVRQIVHNHGGSVTIENGQDIGVICRLVIPTSSDFH